MFTQPFIQAQLKENIKAPRHWPMWRELTGDRSIPHAKDQLCGNVSIWWRHHGVFVRYCLSPWSNLIDKKIGTCNIGNEIISKAVYNTCPTQSHTPWFCRHTGSSIEYEQRFLEVWFWFCKSSFGAPCLYSLECWHRYTCPEEMPL